MENEKYKVVGREISGISTKSFILKNDKDEIICVSVDTVVKLIRNKQVSNASYVLNTYNNKYVINVQGGLAELNKDYNIDKLRVTGRIVKDKKCVGYRVVDTSGKNYKLSINKVWEMSLNNRIHGLSSKIINGNKVLISDNNLDLLKIPVYSM